MEERWAFLEPWCAVLRGRLACLCPTETWESQKRELLVQLPTRFDTKDPTDKQGSARRGAPYYNDADFQGHFQLIRDALALLAAVAQVDKAGWRFLLENKCGVNFGEKGTPRYESQVDVRYLLSITEDEKKHPDSLEEDIIRFCGVNQRAEPSPEYLKALDAIAAVDDHVTRGVDVKIPVHVIFTTSILQDQGAPIIGRPRLEYGYLDPLASIQAAEKVVREQWAAYEETGANSDVESDKLRCTFEMEPMNIDIGDGWATPHMADVLESLVEGNVWFSRISTRLVVSDGLGYCTRKITIGRILASLFASTRRSRELIAYGAHSKVNGTNEDSRPLQIEEIHLDIMRFQMAYDFESMLSAMMVCQTARKLSLSLLIGPNDPRISGHRWEWMAYGLFSKRARACSSLESLALDGIGCLSTEDMEGFARILTSVHPEKEVCFGNLDGQVDDSDATLSASSPIRCKMDMDGQPILDVEDIVFKSSIPSVRVFSDDGSSKWVNVLIPGLGRCHVQRSDLTFARSTRVVPTSPSGLRSLELRFARATTLSVLDGNVCISTGLPDFLRMVGGDLTSLTLAGPRVDLGINEILRSCPRLEVLSITGETADAQLNFSDYRAKSEVVPALNCHWEDIMALARDLCDENNPLVGCVRKLHVRLFYRFNTVLEEIDASLEALWQMLEVNCSLEYLDLRVPGEHFGHFTKFRAHHLTPIRRSLKIPTTTKLAFLSGVTPRDPSTESSNKQKHDHSARYKLNENVLAKILDFAASPVLREVYFLKE